MPAHVTENTLPVGIRAMVLEILLFVGERFPLAWHVFLCALRENRNGFSLDACSVNENTLPVNIRAMVFEILVFVGERFLLAWHAFCVPCGRFAMAFR